MSPNPRSPRPAPWSAKPSVSMKELMLNVALGARDADTLTSLANRVIRLNSQMSPGERKEFAQVVGLPANQLRENLLNAFDEDVLTAQAQGNFQTHTPTEEQLQTVQREAAGRPPRLSAAQRCGILSKMSAAAMSRSSTTPTRTPFCLPVSTPRRRRPPTG